MRLRTALVALLAASPGLLASCTPSDPATQDARGATRTASAASPDTGDSLLVAADLSRIQGSENAPVWLIEVSDFQCPFCRMWHEQTYPGVLREYIQTGKVRMAYIHLPLSSHPHAQPAAEAAMCAGVQGRFWEMTDGIFRTQERWAAVNDPAPVYDSLANAVGVAMPEWRRCVAERQTASIVNADAARAAQMGIRSTPSFVVMRGQEVFRGIAGAYPFETFRATLDSALAGARPAPR